MSQSGIARNTSKINYHFAHRQGVEHDLWKSRILSLQQDMLADPHHALMIFEARVDEWFGDGGES